MRFLFIALCITALTACDGSSPDHHNPAGQNGGTTPNFTDENGDGRNDMPTQSAACNDPAAASMPATPAEGESRAGLSCGIHISIPDDAEIPGMPQGRIAFQVFEPALLEGGKKYPLILDGHGFSGSRADTTSDTGTAGLTVPTGPIVRGGYGLISIDQAGHGETNGLIRIMDPDQEGKFLIALLDWAEENLDWLAYGSDEDAHLASDPVAAANPDNNLLLGAIGPSYGGGYQLLIHAVDPKKRIDVLIPQITWNDLSYSIFPGTVPKALWGAALFSLGSTAGSETERGNFDPFVQRAFVNALSSGQVSPEGLDYFKYHGLGYFCNQEALATGTNGDDGSVTTAGTPYNVDFSPTAPTKVHAMFFQGMRDVLFNFNEAYENYSCLRAAGGDVRLLTYQSGHNTIPVAPDIYTTPDNSLIGTCGELDPTAGALAFFDEYLKGEAGAIDAVLPPGNQICISLQGTDAVLIDEAALPVGLNNTTSFSVPETTIVSGVTPFFPVAVDYDFSSDGNVLAGIPYLDIDVSTACDQVADTPGLSDLCAAAVDDDGVVIFVGTAVNTNGSWALADNQVLPIRGTGRHQVEMVGIGERLTEGSQIGLALFGINEQFVAEGSLNAGSPVILPLTISGDIHLPLVTDNE